MAQTSLMRADEIADAFNGVIDRKYWKASVAGSIRNPEVHFNSRSSMVCISYRIASEDFTVTFSRTSVAFGDFLASTAKAMSEVLASLKAGGLAICDALSDSAVLRVEYDPRAKTCTAHMAKGGDKWVDAEPMAFKVPERKSGEDPVSRVDAL